MKKNFNILLVGMVVLTLSACGNTENVNKEVQKEYYCEEGTLNGQTCEVVATEEVSQTCDEGYKLTDGKCVKTTTTNAKATKSCSEGYTLSGSTCLSKKTVEKVIEKYCVESYTQHQESNGWYYQALRVENGGCVIRICKDGPTEGCYETTAEAKGRLVCPSGTKEVNNKCYKTSKVKTTYSCDAGKLNGSKCTITDTKEVTNTCQTKGFTYNETTKNCEKVTTTQALEK